MDKPEAALPAQPTDPVNAVRNYELRVNGNPFQLHNSCYVGWLTSAVLPAG